MSFMQPRSADSISLQHMNKWFSSRSQLYAEVLVSLIITHICRCTHANGFCPQWTLGPSASGKLHSCTNWVTQNQLMVSLFPVTAHWTKKTNPRPLNNSLSWLSDYFQHIPTAQAGSRLNAIFLNIITPRTELICHFALCPHQSFKVQNSWFRSLPYDGDDAFANTVQSAVEPVPLA